MEHFSNTVENETFCMRLAKKDGFECSGSYLITEREAALFD